MLLDTPVCEFGKPAPIFILKDATGAETALADHLGQDAFLVAFICNHCPFVQRIADRLADDTAKLLSRGIKTFAIMSNDYRDYPADAPPLMAAFAKQHGFTFPYLVDEDQSVGQAYGAVCTPDFFGYDKTGGLQYRGRLTGPNGESELFDAMIQISDTGHGPQEQTPSMGCSIKWA